MEDKAEVLHTVKEKLEEIRAMLKDSIKTDENLLLEPQQTENRKRKINLKLHQLPLRKKKKPFTKRVEVYQRKSAKYQHQRSF